MSKSTGKANFEYEYPYNLMQDIFIDNQFQEYMKNPPLDAFEATEAMLKTLRPREEAFTRARYRDCKTLKAIGEEYGVTGQRIRDVLVRALRKLRHPSRSKTLIYGIKDKGWRMEIENTANDIYQMERMMKRAETNPKFDPFKTMNEFMSLLLEEYIHNHYSTQDRLRYGTLGYLHEHGIFTVGDLLDLSKVDIGKYTRQDNGVGVLYDDLVQRRYSLLVQQKKKMTSDSIEDLSEFFNWYYGKVGE